MVFGIAYSTMDPAGAGIAEALLKLLGSRKCGACRGAVECTCIDHGVMAGFHEEVIYFDFLEERLPANSYIVLSRHSSSHGIKSYTVHHTGNMGSEALYGGKPFSLGVAYPEASLRLLKALRKAAEELGRLGLYEVCYEATHHGPTEVNKPLVFIEIGSVEDDWSNRVNHEVVALAVSELIAKGAISDCIPALGVGGGHYPKKHAEKALREGYCYGHIVAKHSLSNLSWEILEKASRRTSLQPVKIVVEKKGTKIEHRELLEAYAHYYNLSIDYI